MTVWIVLGICAAVFVMLVVLAGAYNLFDGSAAPVRDDRPRQLLPETFTAEDVEAVAFTPVLRGYRMDEVDTVMARLHDRIATLEAGGATAGEDATPQAEHDTGAAAAPVVAPAPSSVPDADARPDSTATTEHATASGAAEPVSEPRRPRRREDLPRTFPES